MRLSESTRVGTLLRRYEQVTQILGWYSVDVIDLEDRMTLEEMCVAYRLDVDDVITDIEGAIDDDEDEDDDEDDDDDEEEDEDDDYDDDDEDDDQDQDDEDDDPYGDDGDEWGDDDDDDDDDD